MDGLILFAMLLVFGIGLGAVFGWIAFFNIQALRRTTDRLHQQIDDLRREVSAARRAATPAAVATERTSEKGAAEEDEPVDELFEPAAPDLPGRATAAPEKRLATPFSHRPAAPKPNPLIESMRTNWMIWLGGTCVALAGIFLVRHSIESGLLGPAARITLGVIGGLVLHGVAEWLRRRMRGAHPAFAALAGGASIMLYAAVFAALALYSLLSPGLTFALLAVVSLLTMALALLHGPLLAIIGILGAYIVPLLVGSEDGNIVVALIYSLNVSAAALLLMRYVYRVWLLAGVVAGALGWWLLALSTPDADGALGAYLAAFAYLVLAVPVFDWSLLREPRRTDPGGEPVRLGWSFVLTPIEIAIMLTVAAAAFSIADVGFATARESLILWTPLIAVVLLASRKRESVVPLCWGMLLTQLGAWLAAGLDIAGEHARLTGLPAERQTQFLAFALIMALVYGAGSWLAARGRPFNHWRTSLTCLSPLLWLALAYLLVSDLSVAWEWSVATLLLGLVYVFASGKRLHGTPDDAGAAWLVLGGHLAYSLAVAMAFREATLTLALAAQVVSATWLLRRFELPALQWIVKGVLAVIVVRLTFNPWLLAYPTDVHWSLWTYGGATACCAVAARIAGVSSQANLRRWLEGVTLHLLVLFLGAEVRYWLYDGRIFIEEYTLTESAINTSLWGALAITYRYRARVSEHLSSFYTACSHILMLLALASYALSLTALNPLWADEPVSSTPIVNLLLLAYGAPVVLAALARHFFDPRFEKLAAATAAGGLFVFVSMQIRHLWQGALDLGLPTTNGELYTYSAVWMIMAVVTILSAARRTSTLLHQAGMGLLLLVIAKIFLVDMSDLDGLLRVASFLGLGLSLLGVAYLHQRITKDAAGPARGTAGA